MINLFFLSIVAYIAGLITFLAPCTLPMIPVYLSMCMKNNFRSLTLNTAYLGIGLAGTFVMFGVFAGSLGSFIAINKLIFSRTIGVLIFLVGLATLLGFSLHRIFPQQKGTTPIAIIAYGALFGLAWSGCIGPVLGGIILLASTTGTAMQGGFMLLMYALGLLTPLFILSMVADKTNKVPKIWAFLKGKGYMLKLGGRELYIHTTNIFAGSLFMLLGLFFFFNGTIWLTSMFPGGIDWVYSMEDKLQTWVVQR